MVEGDEVVVGKSSKYNSGMLQVFRLDYLWKESNRYAIQGLYHKWNDTLDRIWCELVGDIIKNGEDVKKFKELNLKYAETLKRNTPNGFKNYTEKDYNFMYKQKVALMDKEEFLRTLMNKQGKGTAYDDEDDDFE